ncbi:hypothetical protein BGW38_006445 [Lunasporangiospora selenospora]|uniref:Nudix hydrolase domain-containing protein n=1 Tax=Lunasporangiospora selenospora TaxID=979761 RepID=A0A9P6KAY4_9FUNG|nr:hypothetical protein BGW38_006445 [Lunasporangiospora selenospora]
MLPTYPQLNQRAQEALNRLRNHPLELKDAYQTDRRSAVLVALFANNDGDLEVILTLRSMALRTNAGDVAFPGGKKDPVDNDLIATAKREAMEEILLQPSDYEVISVLGRAISKHMFVVTPVVVFCPNMTHEKIASLRPNPGEVDAIFSMPLDYVIRPDPGTYRHQDIQWPEAPFRIHGFQYPVQKNSSIDVREAKESVLPYWTIYGMTASILIEAAMIAFDYTPEYSLYAPGQSGDEGTIALWYNTTLSSSDLVRNRL